LFKIKQQSNFAVDSMALGAVGVMDHLGIVIRSLLIIKLKTNDFHTYLYVLLLVTIGTDKSCHYLPREIKSG
jgi:hypothetical protein